MDQMSRMYLLHQIPNVRAKTTKQLGSTTVLGYRDELRLESAGEGLGNFVHLLFGIFRQDVARGDNFVQDGLVCALDVFQKGGFKGLDVFDIDAVTVSLDSNEERGDNFFGFLGL
eukprot:scaffold10025_cov180-Amphora_coffeaeformis.AAC.1